MSVSCSLWTLLIKFYGINLFFRSNFNFENFSEVYWENFEFFMIKRRRIMKEMKNFFLISFIDRSAFEIIE